MEPANVEDLIAEVERKKVFLKLNYWGRWQIRETCLRKYDLDLTVVNGVRYVLWGPLGAMRQLLRRQVSSQFLWRFNEWASPCFTASEMLEELQPLVLGTTFGFKRSSRADTLRVHNSLTLSDSSDGVFNLLCAPRYRVVGFLRACVEENLTLKFYFGDFKKEMSASELLSVLCGERELLGRSGPLSWPDCRAQGDNRRWEEYLCPHDSDQVCEECEVH